MTNQDEARLPFLPPDPVLLDQPIDEGDLVCDLVVERRGGTCGESDGGVGGGVAEVSEGVDGSRGDGGEEGREKVGVVAGQAGVPGDEEHDVVNLGRDWPREQIGGQAVGVLDTRRRLLRLGHSRERRGEGAKAEVEVGGQEASGGSCLLASNHVPRAHST